MPASSKPARVLFGNVLFVRFAFVPFRAFLFRLLGLIFGGGLGFFGNGRLFGHFRNGCGRFDGRFFRGRLFGDLFRGRLFGGYFVRLFFGGRFGGSKLLQPCRFRLFAPFYEQNDVRDAEHEARRAERDARPFLPAQPRREQVARAERRHTEHAARCVRMGGRLFFSAFGRFFFPLFGGSFLFGRCFAFFGGSRAVIAVFGSFAFGCALLGRFALSVFGRFAVRVIAVRAAVGRAAVRVIAVRAAIGRVAVGVAAVGNGLLFPLYKFGDQPRRFARKRRNPLPPRRR